MRAIMAFLSKCAKNLHVVIEPGLHLFEDDSFLRLRFFLVDSYYSFIHFLFPVFQA